MTFPQGQYHIGAIGEVLRILDRKGNDVLTLPGGMERLVECANVLAHIAFPTNHVPATEDYVKRLEQLRKDAWARVLELEAAQ